METSTEPQSTPQGLPFSELNLNSPQLLANIEALGFKNATPIQSEIIPLALDLKDVSGLSRTGTGKTCAFLIPTIDRLLTLEKHTYALCLTPTRELAIQIETEAKKLCKDLPLRPVSLVGGMPVADQIREIRAGARLIIGTPGRVMDLMRSRMLNPEQIEILVFDEADRMFDMGFIDDMRFILQRVSPKRQILLFSATMNLSVLTMMYEFNCNPVEVNISKDQLTADGIEQVIYHVGENEKPAYLVKFCKEIETGGIIVFVNYREKVLWVADLLTANGIPATGISSLLRQDKRNKILQGFRAGKFQALIATDVASRGLDIKGVALVVNYQLPDETANYVHRIGRTARAGKSGRAVSIAGPDDGYNQLRIEEFIGSKIPVGWLNNDEVDFKVNLPGRARERDRMSRDQFDEQERPQNGPDNIDREEGAPMAEGQEDAPQRAPREGRRHEGRSRGRDRGRGRGGDRDRGDRNDRDRGDRGERNDGDQNREARPPRGEGHSEQRHGSGRDGRRGGGDRDRGGDREGRPGQRAPQEARRPADGPEVAKYQVKIIDRSGSQPVSADGRPNQRPVDKQTATNPLTGSPMVYCTKTGKVKSRASGSSPAAAGGDTERRSLFSKIGSTVTSIFGKK